MKRRAAKIIYKLFVIFITGCYAINLDNNPWCDPDNHKYFNKEQSIKSSYVSPNQREFKLIVDYEDKNQAFNFPQEEVGHIIYVLSQEHKKMGFPNNDKLVDHLSFGHFIITKSDDTFYSLHSNPEYARMKVLDGFIFTEAIFPCWDVPEGPNWSGVLKGQYWNNRKPELIIHELLHVVAYITYGDLDGSHKNQLLWNRKSLLFDSLFKRTIGEYEKTIDDVNSNSDIE